MVFAFLKNMVVDERARYLAEFELTLELARDPELRAEIGDTTDVTRQLARDLLERSGSTAPRPDAVLMSAVMEGLTLEWMARPDDPAFEREIRRYLKANPQFGGLVVNCMGIRADGSPARAKRQFFRWNRRNSRSSSGNAAFDRSALLAVRDAAPFEVPDDPALFERSFRRLRILFRPEDLRN